jgi:hypothetical protein
LSGSPAASARLLADDARQALPAARLSDEDIDRLADDFITEDRGEATEGVIDWGEPGAPRCRKPYGWRRRSLRPDGVRA